jgi:NTP pyrophosphatase (non-canonical NTP hydrolase)
MYYLYHIPGKKIGVTRNLNTRVTLMQGYKEGEYEVLEQSDDINFISDREIELQKSYGYKVDRKLYKNLFKKMNINATEQTSTFPCPANKLKGHLMDNVGLSWETLHGKFEINSTTIPWIVQNAKTSMYNNERCYIYNKAYYEAFVAEPAAEVTDATVFDSIRDWADKRGIYDSGDTKTQFVKLMEEIGELGQAILKDDEAEFIDAIGDSVVVLTNLAKLGGYDIERCIESAYNEISARSGSMVNGTFVKDAD